MKRSGNDRPIDRPRETQSRPATAAGTKELESLGYDEHKSRDDRSFYVHRDANEAQWRRPT